VSRLPIAGSDDVLVLDELSREPGYFSAIRRVGRDGSTKWTVPPPTTGGDDAWTIVRVEGDQVVANSWSCQIVTIDLATGLEQARAFTK
jgi:hypothetical protein